MGDQSRILAGAAIGAGVGALAGYLYWTEHGRRVRVHVEPRLDDFTREIARLTQSINKARGAVAEGWRSLNELAGEIQAPRPEWSGPRQTSPY